MAVRVAARYQRAFEFPTEHALDRYLKDHPDADRAQHTVKKEEHKDPSKPEDGGEKKPGKHEEGGEEGEKEFPHTKPKTSWKDAVKNLSSKAMSFFQQAPEKIKSFATDEDFRRKTLMAAHEAIEKAPEQFVERAKKAIKQEAHEFKEAGSGVWTLLKGGKLDEHQKKAIKGVVTDIAITAAVSAVTGGLAAGAGGLVAKTASSFAYGLMKKVVARTVSDSLTHAPLLHELAHGFHGLAEIAGEFLKMAGDEDEESKPEGNSNRVPNEEEVFDQFCAAIAMYSLKHVDASSLTDGLEACADLGEQEDIDTEEPDEDEEEEPEEEDEEEGDEEPEPEETEPEEDEEPEPEGQEKQANARVAALFAKKVALLRVVR